jgi:hypothetical protein
VCQHSAPQILVTPPSIILLSAADAGLDGYHGAADRCPTNPLTAPDDPGDVHARADLRDHRAGLGNPSNASVPIMHQTHATLAEAAMTRRMIRRAPPARSVASCARSI